MSEKPETACMQEEGFDFDKAVSSINELIGAITAIASSVAGAISALEKLTALVNEGVASEVEDSSSANLTETGN